MLRNVKAVKAARGPSGFVLASFVEAVELWIVTLRRRLLGSVLFCSVKSRQLS